MKLGEYCHPEITVTVRQPVSRVKEHTYKQATTLPKSDNNHRAAEAEFSSYLRSLQASQLHAMSEGEELLRSAAGTVCAPTVILSPPTDSCCDPLFPRGMCKRKSWL